MKAGSTGYLKIELAGLNLNVVSEVVFTIKARGGSVSKVYPDDVELSNGKFLVPLDQHETTTLCGWSKVEAQINYSDNSVSKTETFDLLIKDTIATKYLDENEPSDDDVEISLAVETVQIVSSGSGSGGTTVDAYTKTETNTLLAAKADKTTVYTKTETDTALALKADKTTVYTKTEVDTALSGKADKTTTYTKTEIDTALTNKANASDVYTKTQADAKFALIGETVTDEQIAEAVEDYLTENPPSGNGLTRSQILMMTYGATKIVDGSGVVSGANCYTSLATAIGYASENDTILVMPYIYDDVVLVCDKKITLLGLDKDTCILQNDRSTKGYFPLDAKKGTYKNLTFKSFYNADKIGTHSYEYAVHIDSVDTSNDSERRIIAFENCNFYSELAPAVGMGHSANMTISFKNCQFENVDRTPATATNGAFYIHLPITGTGGNGQKLILENCRIKSNSIKCANIDLRSECQCTFIRNTFESSYNGWHKDISVGTLTLLPSCYGNNTIDLNYSGGQITEVDKPCTSLSLNKTNITLSVEGVTETLTITKAPSDTTDTVAWTSSNTEVATVSNGIVTAVGEGNCTITVTCGEQSATCSVEVAFVEDLTVVYTVNDYYLHNGQVVAQSGNVMKVFTCLPNTSYHLAFVDTSMAANWGAVWSADRYNGSGLVGTQIIEGSYGKFKDVTTGNGANYLWVCARTTSEFTVTRNS